MEVNVFLFVWFLLSVIIGLLSYKRGNTFYKGFLISSLLSPLIGLIIVLITKKKTDHHM